MTGGWQAWNTGASQATWSTSAGHAMAAQVMKYFFAEDPALDFLKMDLGAGFERRRQAVGKVVDAVDPDLRAFARHGGRLIQYHGWNDPAIAPRGSVRYHDAVVATTPGAASFYRLYMIPGMLHCRGGAGPGEVEWLDVLDRWVDAGEAPKSLLAKAAKSDETQLLCPYPAVARPNGKGGWVCRK
jgi:feruloyl esterase